MLASSASGLSATVQENLARSGDWIYTFMQIAADNDQRK
jgi:hypothetical protein